VEQALSGEEIEAALDVWADLELPDRDTLWRGAIDQPGSTTETAAGTQRTVSGKRAWRSPSA